MGNEVCFIRGCPICGRSLQIPVNLLGTRVYCQHCGGGFTADDGRAGDGCGTRPAQERVVDDLLARASRALRQAAHSSGPAD